MMAMANEIQAYFGIAARVRTNGSATVMPNGKQLGDCTFGEIKAMEARMAEIVEYVISLRGLK